MAKYRFKTKEEFIRDGEWFHKRDTPIGWNDAGRMNHFLGQDIPEKYNEKCDRKDSFFNDDWHFASTNYVLKETKPVNRYTDFVFIPGNIYVGEWDSHRVIFKPTTACLDDPCYIITSTDEFILNKNGCCSAGGVSFREANQEEKDWLEACIKANATVPRPSNSTPEYVECIGEFPPYYGEKGKIYKVKVWNYSYSDCMLEGTTSGSTDRSRFKPSTKEAYDAQNASVVDKWAIKYTEENKEHLKKFFHSKSSEYVGYTSSWNVSMGHYYHYPQQEVGLWGHIAIQKGYREITTEEFYKIAGVVTDVVDTPNFEVGKWYKLKDASKAYRKCSHKQLTDERMLYSEGINGGTYNSTGSSCEASHDRLELLTDLSEIQPYLPDGHPDKFPVAEQKMFKKGDYIVYLSKGTCLLLQNYCYKQSQDENYLRVEKDASGVKNLWPALGRYEESHNWRYATPEEIAEYNRLDKPYDVTTISNKVSFKQGDYIVITECNHKAYNGDLNHCYKLITDDFHIGSNSRIPLDQPEDKKARLATPEEIAEYDRLGKPYDVTTLFQKKAEQKSFPQYIRTTRGVVCKLVDSDYSQEHYLVENSNGEKIIVNKKSVSEAQEHEYYAVKPPKEMKKTIDFKSLSFGKWLEETKKLNLSLIDLQQHINNGSICDFKNVYQKIPGHDYVKKAEYLFNLWNSEKQPSIPGYVKCINGYGNALVGKIYRTDDEYQAKSLFGMTWEKVLIHYNHLGTKFIPATYLEYSEHHSEKAEESKPSTIGYPIKKETLIEDVHSVSVMLSTKNKSKQFKF